MSRFFAARIARVQPCGLRAADGFVTPALPGKVASQALPPALFVRSLNLRVVLIFCYFRK